LRQGVHRIIHQIYVLTDTNNIALYLLVALVKKLKLLLSTTILYADVLYETTCHIPSQIK